MNIRQALREQSSSLTLQRAAADEIARLDKVIFDLARTAEMIESGVALLKSRIETLAANDAVVAAAFKKGGIT